MLPKDPAHQQTAHLGTYYKEKNMLNELIFLESLLAAVYCEKAHCLLAQECRFQYSFRNVQANYFN